MPQKYYNLKETAKVLGLSEGDVKQMLEQRQLHGYRDGTDWKFKVEDVERVAHERAKSPPPAAESDDGGDVLASEIELGHSDPGLSGTVIGTSKGKAVADSDIRLADSDIKLAPSGIDLGQERKPAGKDDVAAKVSQFEELDLTLDQDLSLEDASAAPPAAKGAAKKPAPKAAAPKAAAPKAAAPAAGDSAIDLASKPLEDDDLVLGGSGTGSDITIGGDSGISLVDPADSGLSLEAPLNLAGAGEESLELGEDDLLAAAEGEAPAALKSEDDFQLTPMEDTADSDESESGSQVIALDTEAEGDEAATMVAAGGGVAAMLDEDLGTMPGAGLLPAGDVGLAGQADIVALDQLAAAMALPEAPYTVGSIVGLVVCSLLLMLVGIMVHDLLKNMWSWDSVNPINSGLMDTILGWFEK
ncbi:MAG: helix-turn-helix domain-containing protein [Thermoguttaceae bacterium]|jgi:excisionase family DNA binding protein